MSVLVRPRPAPTVPPPYIVGLTGGIAAGKSSVARHWAQRFGAAVMDADRFAREVVAPGSEGLARLVERFGREVLTPEGALDRAHMRARIFNDPAARRDVEGIVHPLVQQRSMAAFFDFASAGHNLVVYEATLIYEAGLSGMCTRIVVVTAPDDVRVARIQQRDGGDEAQARAALAAQMPQAEKADRADLVIANDGDEAALVRDADTAWTALRNGLGLPST